MTDHREAAELFFARTGRSVDQRLAGMADSARRAREYLTSLEDRGARRAGLKHIGQWAARQLDCAVQTFQRLPPQELVDLFLFLHDAEGPPEPLRPKGWHKVAAHKAAYPEKSTRDLAKLVNVSHALVAKWLRVPAMQTEIANVRATIDQLGFDEVKHFLDL